MDDYDDTRYLKRVPRDEFEAELFRRYIEREAARWYNDEREINISVSEDHIDGVYDLFIWEPLGHVWALENKGQLRGKVWLQENPYPVSEFYRVQVWHHCERQTENYGAAPILWWIVEETIGTEEV